MLDISKRKEFLHKKFFESHGVTPSQVSAPKRAKMWSIVFDEILPKIIDDKPDRSNMINKLFDRFNDQITPFVIELKKKSMLNDSNIYEMSRAQTLSSANAITRSVSTKLGLFWEDVANLSNNVVSTELEFGIKIQGVDVITFHNNNLYYTQLKTQKNTLTGSQADRVNDELGIFNHSWFVACIKNNSSWTYSGKTPRLLGEEYWSKTTIKYNDLLDNLYNTIQNVEKLANS
ncbi:hypothetical protein [Cohnella abietis]|uniref:Type II restriction endonuclease EcoO109IR domain-containing protein n=1 Tax=Cohnella abietis TaxID=2507935 RepID=A0A3T1CYB8_9BACL|nr:hypothetical protein [Cohnella abietis]BBI30769.1 hypothetical protein KCTCHS21_01680 [Cohnella abietis]